MALDISVLNIEKDLEEMETKISSIDMEKVKKRTMKRIADEMAREVRQAVFESSIKSPADKISPYEGGDGPPMATQDAWLVQPDGANRYRVVPHPEVRQRAMVLNFGYPGRITPNSADALRFTVDGVPVYRQSVKGPERVGYWQQAFQRLQASDKLQEIGQEELNIEFEEKF